MLTSVPPAIRVIIADRFVMFRDALRAALTAVGGFAVVAEACNGDEAIRRVQEHRPHVLVLDLVMPHVGGLDALRQLRDGDTGVHTVLLANIITSEEAVAALTLGARGVLTKDVMPPLLFECIRTVARGNYWIGGERMRDVVAAVNRVRTVHPPSPADNLTARETEVVAAVVGGETNREICVELKISVQTVKNHLSHVFDKLGVSSRLELAMYAARQSAELLRPVTDLRH